MMKTSKWSWRALVTAAAVAVGFWSTSVQAAPAVENVTGSLQGGTEVVRIDFSEPLTKLPSHRILAMFRGEKEEILDLQIQPEATAADASSVFMDFSPFEAVIWHRASIAPQRPARKPEIRTLCGARAAIAPYLSAGIASASASRRASSVRDRTPTFA